jgi:hypothetical protein
VSFNLSEIEWDSPPPRRSPNARTGHPTPSQIVVAASMRPGVWGSLDVGDPNRSAKFAYLLRASGVEAVSRRSTVYFRGAHTSAN